MLRLLWQINLRSAKDYFKKERAARLITASLFLFVFVMVAVGLYFFFRFGFTFLKKDLFFAPVLSLLAYEIFFLGVSALMFASALISGLFGFFRIEASAWLLSSPCFRVLPWYVISKIFVASLWPFLVVALPGLLAIQAVSHLGPAGFFIMLGSIIFLAVFSAVLAAISILMIAKFLYLAERIISTRMLTMGRIVCVLSVVLVGLSYFFWVRITRLDTVAILQPYNLMAQAAALPPLISQFSMLPSHFTALALYELEYASFSDALMLSGGLFLLALGGMILFRWMSLWYLELWQILQEGHSEALPGQTPRRTGALHFPRYLSGPYGAFFEKEALVVFRDGKNTLWFLFAIFLWLIQVATNIFLQRNMGRLNPDHASFPFMLQALQVIIIIYFSSSFVLRFGFPLFSLEKKTAWIIGSAPISLVRVFWSKMIFYAACFTSLTVLFALLNSAILAMPLATFVFFLLIVVTATIAITFFGLCLGAIAPNVETDDPEILSTSLSGLFFIALSLLYGAFGSLAFYQFVESGSFLPGFVFEVASLLLVWFFVSRALRAIACFEFEG